MGMVAGQAGIVRRGSYPPPPPHPQSALHCRAASSDSTLPGWGRVWGEASRSSQDAAFLVRAALKSGRDPELTWVSPAAWLWERGIWGRSLEWGEVRTLFGFVTKKGKSSPFPAGGLSKFPMAEFILED